MRPARTEFLVPVGHVRTQGAQVICKLPRLSVAAWLLHIQAKAAEKVRILLETSVSDVYDRIVRQVLTPARTMCPETFRSRAQSSLPKKACFNSRARGT
jgi:hypothetical protein